MALIMPAMSKGGFMGANTAEPQLVRSVSARSAQWWRTATNLQLICAGTALVVVIFVVLTGLDVLLRYYPNLSFLLPLADLAVALLCGGLLARVIHDARKRAHLVQQRLRIVAEMNHHIRNALEDIELTAHAQHRREATESIDMAVSRIEWALREILPREFLEEGMQRK
jgi:hypothetical protein